MYNSLHHLTTKVFVIQLFCRYILMLMRYLLALILSLFAYNGFTQDSLRGKIAVSFAYEKNEPLENATVELLAAKDSA